MWNKKNISKNDVEALQSKYGIDPLTASIMVRRGITKGKDILYYMEDDLRFQHSPFSFNAMEDAVDRILMAAEKDEQGQTEKVLIFGDRDVDGVTATTLLYDCLSSMGIDVRYKVPKGDDPYGLTMDCVEKFAEEYGSLIITVDCGIANVEEAKRCEELGIDLIIVDHHNPQEEIPSPAIILDAWLPDSGYPFKEISGCAVVYKLVSAIRFSKSEWYKTDIALLNARVEDDSIVVEVIKTRNLVPVSRLTETVVPGSRSITDTRLPSYLQGQLILVWNERNAGALLAQAFGKGAQFNFMDLQKEMAKLFPSMAEFDLDKIKSRSKIAKYGDHAPTEIGGFYNIYVTFAQQQMKKSHPQQSEAEEKDLQLVALAALADIMPMKDENRIFVKKGIESINAGHVRPGLIEIMSQLELLGKRISSSDLSWTLVPCLNAPGRLGHAEYAADLFLSKDSKFREETARKIVELNKERKQLTLEADGYVLENTHLEEIIRENHGKLCIFVDERTNRGINGIVAGHLVSRFNIPSISISFVGDVAVGSMRSCRDFSVTQFLENLSDMFISHGGHDFAAGFSFEKSRLSEFMERAKNEAKDFVLSDDRSGVIDVDAEVPAQYMTPDLIKISDRFEPFGDQNQTPVFMARNLPIESGMCMGKTDRHHLKITVNCGNTKWPCLFWGQGDRWNSEFKVGDKVDILFNIERNLFNGVELLQLGLIDINKS